MWDDHDPAAAAHHDDNRAPHHYNDRAPHHYYNDNRAGDNASAKWSSRQRLFANDKAVLRAHDRHVLNALARSLMASGTTHVKITGYANYLGTRRINVPLSLYRANVTKNYLDAALTARGDTGVSFTVKGAGVLTIYSNIALDRVAIVTG